MSCSEHPFDQIKWVRPTHQRVQPPQKKPSLVKCEVCKEDFHFGITPREFLDFRSVLFMRQMNRDPNLARDMFYQPLDIGSTIVYPAMSGRSAQLVTGSIMDINLNKVRDPYSQDELDQMMAEGRHGEPYSMRVLPGDGSRWSQHTNRRWVSGQGFVPVPQKPVTLWANAGSAVLINVDEDAP